MSAFLDTVLAPDVLARARTGDEEALAAIYRAFEVPVRTLARRIVVPRAAADDVAQDVFVDVITHLHQYDGRGSFAGWVRSIAVTRCLRHLRSPWQRSRCWLDDATRTLDELQEQVKGTGWATDGGDAVDLERALAHLGASARAVVWLHDVEGYTHTEIGAHFGASASFSKSQLARAHARLRELLQVDAKEAACGAMTSTP